MGTELGPGDPKYKAWPLLSGSPTLGGEEKRRISSGLNCDLGFLIHSSSIEVFQQCEFDMGATNARDAEGHRAESPTQMGGGSRKASQGCSAQLSCVLKDLWLTLSRQGKAE